MSIRSVISLRDNFTSVMRVARNETRNFNRDVRNTRSALDRLTRQRREVRIRARTDTINNALNGLRRRLEPFRRPIITRMALVSRGFDRLRNIRNRVVTITQRMRDVTAPVIGRIKAGLGSLGAFAKKTAVAIGVGLLAGLGTGIKGSLLLEQQKVSMEHFIGTQNKGMSKEQIGQSSNEYIKWLRQNANATPFETGEVIGAGARAVNVAGGDVSKAKNLVTLAEDMAALNPGKSVSDAMEALADLKLGETERMKEFGFKLSADDFTGGKGKMSNMTPEELSKAYDGIVSSKLNPFFKGGAEKIAKTRQGQISTIMGVGKSILTDVSTKLLEKDGGSLGKLANYMSNNADRIVNKMSSAMDKTFKVIGTGWNYLVEGFKVLMPYLTPIANFLKVQFADRVSFIGTLISQWKPVFMQLWTTLSNAFTTLWPVISNLFSNVGNLIKSIMTIVSPILAELATAFLNIVNNYVVPLIGKIGGFISSIVGFVSSALNIVSPLIVGFVTGVIKIFSGIIDFITGVFTGNWRKAWEGIKNIFMGIWNGISGVISTISNVIDKVKGYKGSNITVSNTGAKTKLTGHATGLNRVPRDNYPALLHEGEQVLTAQEARQGKGNGGANLDMLIARIVEMLGKTSKEIKIEIAKIADSIIIREEADIYKIADAIAEKLEGITPNLT